MLSLWMQWASLGWPNTDFKNHLLLAYNATRLFALPVPYVLCKRALQTSWAYLQSLLSLVHLDISLATELLSPRMRKSIQWLDNQSLNDIPQDVFFAKMKLILSQDVQQALPLLKSMDMLLDYKRLNAPLELTKKLTTTHVKDVINGVNFKGYWIDLFENSSGLPATNVSSSQRLASAPDTTQRAAKADINNVASFATSKHQPLELPQAPAGPPSVVLLWVHGGAFVVGSAQMHADAFAVILKAFHNICPSSGHLRIFSVDYDLAPTQCFPTAQQQVVAAFKWLSQSQGYTRIVIGGDSAGGNLVLSALLKMQDDYARHAALQAGHERAHVPSAVVLYSPWVDLSTTYDSPLVSHQDYLVFNANVGELLKSYLGSGNNVEELRCHPYVSPAFGDLGCLPPMKVIAGGGEVMKAQIDGFVKRARQLGADVDYEVGGGLYHNYPCVGINFGIPQALEALRRTAEFIAAHCDNP